MAIRSLLLRVLLSLCLILNGAGAAASVPMAGHDAMTASMPAAEDADPMPCHGDMENVATDTQASLAADADGGRSATPDCCESGACRCACVHVAHAGIPVLQISAASIDHDRSVRPLTLAHAAPALPHPIRPPIG